MASSTGPDNSGSTLAPLEQSASRMRALPAFVSASDILADPVLSAAFSTGATVLAGLEASAPTVAALAAALDPVLDADTLPVPSPAESAVYALPGEVDPALLEPGLEMRAKPFEQLGDGPMEVDGQLVPASVTPVGDADDGTGTSVAAVPAVVATMSPLAAFGNMAGGSGSLNDLANFLDLGQLTGAQTALGLSLETRAISALLGRFGALATHVAADGGGAPQAGDADAFDFTSVTTEAAAPDTPLDPFADAIHPVWLSELLSSTEFAPAVMEDVSALFELHTELLGGNVHHTADPFVP